MHGSVVITGGGTGGHLKVAKAFEREFTNRGVRCIFIGSKNGQDQQWFDHDIKLRKAIFLDTRGVVNKGFLGKIKSLFQIYTAMTHCQEIFEKADVKTVISVGGFSAAPATFASIFRSNCKLYIHEQNSVMGKLNKITARFATELFSSYDENSRIKDYPVDMDFFDEAKIRENVKTVIFLGGSQGAVFINEFALKVAKHLDGMGIKIIHQTGQLDFARVKKKYDDFGINADVFDFDMNIAKKMGQADFAVSRSGASTLWELSANSLPTLFIPYPYAAKDHQYHNAKFLMERNLCFIQRENELKEKYFFDCLNDESVHKMSQGLVHSILLDGIKSMVDIIVDDNTK
ncbi:MAG: UDP-N-acetylglucosamine--N-acetylmuramyl-(pentapeptide) pyrophosphoryl-undecaprenol N-acetylglucosamine transferase [Campylobacteraceae bacterium]|nr:UDP-N-acetylglucosamine--N-acetylmuramyl-(pentapeptide) pyrophosphoryl-undecaprenol N-acetylglucosamine transferase [Campylobacteraceae bacterium]